MKLFNYLKLAVIFSILILAFSCNDNENLDEIIEPELELVGRENSFTTDGIISEDQSDKNTLLIYNCVKFCFKKGLSNLQKYKAVDNFYDSKPEIKSKIQGALIKISRNCSDCEIWSYGRPAGPNDDDDNDDKNNDDDELILDLVGKQNIILPRSFNDSFIVSYSLSYDCQFTENYDQECNDNDNDNDNDKNIDVIVK
ncbi:hypothetical protein ACSIGC_05670 [Tenacibaculum sp. ZS6-P6]|uniref:hypothetical protein n=1 Tax=Tenacibaculum sp. ZS6-P6 TaxID=3447503 RepID=UPI003F96FAE2